jgi:hypothetical protein
MNYAHFLQLNLEILIVPWHSIHYMYLFKRNVRARSSSIRCRYEVLEFMYDQNLKSNIYLVFRAQNSDNVCCYDKDGNLIDSRVKEGGTLQRYHYLGGVGNVPYVTNFYYDVLPFLHCCRYFGTSIDNGHRGIATFSECQDFLGFRNVSSCYNYIPPRPGIWILQMKFDILFWNLACHIIDY